MGHVHGVAVGRGIVGCDNRAWFEVHAGDALDARLQPHLVCGFGEGCVGRPRITNFGVKRNIARYVLPQLRCARTHCLRGQRDRRQGLPCDLNQVGRISGRGQGLRDHHDDCFAGKARAIRRQQRLLGGEPLAAVAVAQRHVRSLV